MKRGDIVTAATPGDYGKPRPAVIVQSDRLVATNSVLVCPCTSDLTNASAIRVDVMPTLENGLRLPSQIMTEKLTVMPREKCGGVIGKLDLDSMQRLEETLTLVLGLAD